MTKQELTNLFTTDAPKYVSLKNAAGETIISCNLKPSEAKKNFAEIINKLYESKATPNGIYNVVFSSNGSKKSTGITIQVNKGNVSLNDAPQPIAKKSDYSPNISFTEAINYITENANLKAENKRLEAENKDLNNYILDLEAELTASENLSDNKGTNLADYITPLLPALGALASKLVDNINFSAPAPQTPVAPTPVTPAPEQAPQGNDITNIFTQLNSMSEKEQMTYLNELQKTKPILYNRVIQLINEASEPNE